MTSDINIIKNNHIQCINHCYRNKSMIDTKEFDLLMCGDTSNINKIRIIILH